VTIIDDNHAVLWTWDEPVPLLRPSHEPPPAPFDGLRLPLAVGLGTVLFGLLVVAVLVVIGRL
jgi:hypothetical protein